MIRLFLLRFLETYFRHPWLYLLPAIGMSIFGILVVTLSPPTYESNGVIHVQQESLLASLTSVRETGFGWVTPAEATVMELTELLQTDSFVRAMIKYTDLESELTENPKDLLKGVRKAIEWTTLGDNQIMIGATHEDPAVAQQLVSGLMESYLQWQINIARNESATAQEFFGNLIDEYKADLESARQELGDYLMAHPEPIRGERPDIEEMEIGRLQAGIDFASTRYLSALEKDENARLSAAQIASDVRQNCLIVDSPRLPDESSSSLRNTALKLIAFGIVGMMLSVLAMVGAMMLDRSFLFPVDVQHNIELPVLATIPQGLETPRTHLRRVSAESTNIKRAHLIPLSSPPTLVIAPNQHPRHQQQYFKEVTS